MRTANGRYSVRNVSRIRDSQMCCMRAPILYMWHKHVTSISCNMFVSLLYVWCRVTRTYMLNSRVVAFFFC